MSETTLPVSLDTKRWKIEDADGEHVVWLDEPPSDPDFIERMVFCVNAFPNDIPTEAITPGLVGEMVKHLGDCLRFLDFKIGPSMKDAHDFLAGVLAAQGKPSTERKGG